MKKALKRKVNDILMPVEIHRNEWLMHFYINFAIFKSTALLQKVCFQMWMMQQKIRLITSTTCLWFLYASVGQTALHLQCFTSPVFNSWQLGNCVIHQHTFVIFFHTSLLVSALPLTLLWAVEYQMRSRASLLPLGLRSCIKSQTTCVWTSQLKGSGVLVWRNCY